MTVSSVRKDVDNGVTMLTLQRPPVNALNPDFLLEIESQLSNIEADENVRALIITSNLSVFSAGMDLKEAMDFSTADQTLIVDLLNSTFARLYGMSKPVIVAANGAAIAGGMFFVLAADYSIAVERAKFGLAEVRVGLHFPVVALEIARNALSASAFRRVMLSGRNLDAKVAEKMGIVDEVVSGDELIRRSLEVAGDYASIPPMAYAKVKAQMRAASLDRLNNIIDKKSDPARAGWFSDETRGAMESALKVVRRKE